MWISERGGGSADVDNFFFYNIIIKCRNVDKGRGGGGQTMWIRIFVCFRPF